MASKNDHYAIFVCFYYLLLLRACKHLLSRDITNKIQSYTWHQYVRNIKLGVFPMKKGSS